MNAPAATAQTFVIQYEVNDACNLRCSHCYHGRKVIKENPITLQRLFDDIAELKTVLGPQHKIVICLSGGEVLVRKDLNEMAFEIMRKGYASFLLTNGTLVTADNAAELLIRGVKLARISLDGGTAELHDAIRGAGQLEKSLQGIRTLLKTGQRVAISNTLMQGHNDRPEQIESLFQLAEREGIFKLNFFRMFAQGDAKDTPARAFTDAQRFKAVLESIWDLALKYPQLKVVIKDPLAKNIERPLPENLTIDVCCYIKKNHLSVAASGKVYACRKLEQHVGDLFTDTLANIWQHSSMLQQMADRRQYMQGKCRTCPINNECKGGCLAASFGETGQLFVPDPACWREEEAPLPLIA